MRHDYKIKFLVQSRNWGTLISSLLIFTTFCVLGSPSFYRGRSGGREHGAKMRNSIPAWILPTKPRTLTPAHSPFISSSFTVNSNGQAEDWLLANSGKTTDLEFKKIPLSRVTLGTHFDSCLLSPREQYKASTCCNAVHHLPILSQEPRQLGSVITHTIFGSNGLSQGSKPSSLNTFCFSKWELSPFWDIPGY
jgi:hypothetical protein